MKFNRCLIMLFLAFSLDGIANETEIVTKINQVLPTGMSVKGIKQSQVEGLFVVDIGDLQPIYASKDGNFFLYGDSLYTLPKMVIFSYMARCMPLRTANY